MSYYSFYHLFLTKNSKYVDLDELPKDLVKQLNAATTDIEDENDEYGFDGLHEEHDSDLEDNLLSISKQYPDYTFLVREYPLELDEVSYDYFRNGKHIKVSMDPPIPTIPDGMLE
mgnify:CR=1 FL=1